MWLTHTLIECKWVQCRPLYNLRSQNVIHSHPMTVSWDSPMTRKRATKYRALLRKMTIFRKRATNYRALLRVVRLTHDTHKGSIISGSFAKNGHFSQKSPVIGGFFTLWPCHETQDTQKSPIISGSFEKSCHFQQKSPIISDSSTLWPCQETHNTQKSPIISGSFGKNGHFPQKSPTFSGSFTLWTCHETHSWHTMSLAI